MSATVSGFYCIVTPLWASCLTPSAGAEIEVTDPLTLPSGASGSTSIMEPILARPIPRCSIDGQPYMEEHDVFLVKKIDQLVKTQMNPAFRKIRTRKGRRAGGPFVVAVRVSEEIYDAFVAFQGDRQLMPL
jgi:hypothetical protein